MRALVVGGGGREHAIVNHLVMNSSSVEVISAPGNPGIASLCRTFDIATTDVQRLTDLALSQGVDVAIIGPEVALAAGVADALRRVGVAVLGPGSDGARLETSKAWAKSLMREAAIPTAPAERFTDSAHALSYLNGKSMPIVVKADGLAAGKGAVVCRSVGEARDAVTSMLDDAVFGEAGSTILIEDFLVGEEYSMMIFTDGECICPMPLSQDHKPINDGDLGPNTGGMGAYAPVPSLRHASQITLERVFKPLLSALKRRGIDYRGVITGNLIWTQNGPFVIEFNARFGDPEAEVTLPLLRSNLLEIVQLIDGRALSTLEVEWADEWALCVVLTAEGYPGECRSGDVIETFGTGVPGTVIFHAGTKSIDEQLVTAGGRVLIATGHGASFAEARARAYAAAESVRFAGKHFRSDIGWRAERYLAATSPNE